MTVSLRAIRYSNFGADERPFVVDVDTLNTTRGWGLRTDPEKPWKHAKGQLALIDSVSLAIYADDVMSSVIPQIGYSVSLSDTHNQAIATATQVQGAEALSITRANVQRSNNISDVITVEQI